MTFQANTDFLYKNLQAVQHINSNKLQFKTLFLAQLIQTIKQAHTETSGRIQTMKQWIHAQTYMWTSTHRHTVTQTGIHTYMATYTRIETGIKIYFLNKWILILNLPVTLF